MQNGGSTYEPLSLVLTFIFGIATLILGILSFLISKKKSEQEHELIKYKEYLKNLKMIEPKFIDVIFLGPRQSGKTSIVELWTSPWTQIDKIKSTSDWRIYEKDIHEFAEEKRNNSSIDIEQIYIPTLRLKAYDFPGEDSYKVTAAEKLNDLAKKVVLVLVLDVGFVDGQIANHNRNADYYSYLFVQTIRNRVDSMSSKIAKVIIVFNKCDTLPPGWSESQATKYLLEKNDHALQNINTLFSGKLEYCLTSARTNSGLIGLLGCVGLAGIETPKEREKFKDALKRFEEELTAINS